MKGTAVFKHLLPQRIDNTYHGYKLALWLLAVVVIVKTLQSGAVIIDGYSIAESADGIPLNTYSPEAAQTILALFQFSGLSRLILAGLSVLALVRYRSAVPFMLALLALEYLARQVILYFVPIVRVGTVPGPTVNLALFLLTIIGLAMSVRSRTTPATLA
jgi:hypothetical protein